MKKKQPRFETSSGSKKVDDLVEKHNGQIRAGRATISLPESRRNGKSKIISDVITDILTETVSVNDKFQGIKLGSKFQRKGDASTFILRRRTKPVAPGSTQYVGELYLYSKASNEFIFHYAVPTEFTPID